MITLRLPNPPSANRYWRHDRGVTHISQEALDYREMVGWVCVNEGVSSFGAESALALTLDFYGLRASRDLDNNLKQVLDALQGHCFVNDNQFVDIHLRRHDLPKLKVIDGYVIVEIKEVE